MWYNVSKNEELQLRIIGENGQMAHLFLASETNGISSEVWAAIISAAVSIVIGVVSGLLTEQKAKINFYSSTVSKERVAWINQTREITGKLIAFCSVHEEDNLSPEDMLLFEELRSALLMRLSPKEYVEKKQKYIDTDGKLIELLDQEYKKVRENRYEIRTIVTLICKNEWNRIKAEAGGSKDVEKKIKKYDDSVENNNQKK